MPEGSAPRAVERVMLHFAYGSNMHRKLMAKHAPAAELLGTAELHGHRFIVTADGYASAEPKPGHTVRGVLWRIAPRDRARLDAWESIAAGLYRATTLPVRHRDRSVQALVYLARAAPIGQPKPGYMELVIAAAQEWQFPKPYLASLRQWLPRPIETRSGQPEVSAWTSSARF